MQIQRILSVFLFACTLSFGTFSFADAQSRTRSAAPKPSLTCSDRVLLVGGFNGKLKTKISFRGKVATVAETVVKLGGDNSPFQGGSNQKEPKKTFTLEVRSIYRTESGDFIILRKADSSARRSSRGRASQQNAESNKIYVVLIKGSKAYLRAAEPAQYDPSLAATMIGLITAETNSGTANWNAKVDPEVFKTLLRNRNIPKLKPENFKARDFDRPSSGE